MKFMLEAVWILISPITFGAFVPLLYHYVLMGRGSNEVLIDTLFIYLIYTGLWFKINDKINSKATIKQQSNKK